MIADTPELTLRRRPPTDGFDFLGAQKLATGSWFMPCPSCCEGLVVLLPASLAGWRIATEWGCNEGCTAPAVAWWQAWRLGRPFAVGPNERGRRYARGAARGVLKDLARADRPCEMRRLSFRLGQLVEGGELDMDVITAGMLKAVSSHFAEAMEALEAGRAEPARLP